MGDRGNVFIRGSRYDVKTRSEKPAKIGIWIYGHWSGYNFPLSVRDAIVRNGGHGASVRNVLCEALKRCYGEEPEQMREALNDTFNLSVGLSMQDNEYPITFVDNHNKRVGFTKEPPPPFTTPPEPEMWIPFAEFVKMDDDTIRSLRSAVKWRR
jgi:hypothetical protein